MNAHNSHPEALEGEILLCYAVKNSYLLIGWKTKRKGSQIIGNIAVIRGTKREDYFPVFIQTKEVTDPQTRKSFGLDPLPPADPLARTRLASQWNEFAYGSADVVHTRGGMIDPNDRRNSGLFA